MSDESTPPRDDLATASEDLGLPDVPAHPDPAPSPPADAAPVPGEADAVADAPFSQLLEVSAPVDPRALAVGQRVRGRILSIGDEDTIISLSGRPDAVLPTRDLRGPDGTVLLRVDDPVSAEVLAVEMPIRLGVPKRRGLLNAARVRTAFEEKRPVNGVVRAVNKGGFEVRVNGVRGFCPLSQIDYGTVLEPPAYVGQTYTFRVLRWENGGRDIVLSRRALLKEEHDHKAAGTRERLAVGAEFEGTVTRIQSFGAFVDIGGIEGLLHVSRMGRGHVADPSQVVSPGQTIRVKVTRLDNPGTRQERIALAATELGPDPWEAVPETLREGEIVHGRVARRTEFGLFVNLVAGIDGLVHVSEFPPRHAEEPEPALQPGDDIEVRVVRVDQEKKRVSLSLRLQPPAARPASREGRPSRPRRDRDRDRDRDRERERDPAPFGAGGSLTHTMAEQLGALRRKLQARP